MVRDLAGYAPDDDCIGALVQYPTTDGEVVDYAGLADAVRQSGGYLAVATDLLALTLIEAPGEWGADVALGSSQRFGVPMGFGGPHAAFFSHHRRVRAQDPGSHHRREPGPPRRHRAADGAADARAAHPTREGDL